ncbi:hypothetical protein C8J57DRAFT_1721249 [Mycena rebaudengoi]|nr:hypothetical protein C8J57DRAFT_1721249 [Mycena rebaudengoi]
MGGSPLSQCAAGPRELMVRTPVLLSSRAGILDSGGLDEEAPRRVGIAAFGLRRSRSPPHCALAYFGILVGRPLRIPYPSPPLLGRLVPARDSRGRPPRFRFPDPPPTFRRPLANPCVVLMCLVPHQAAGMARRLPHAHPADAPGACAGGLLCPTRCRHRGWRLSVRRLPTLVLLGVWWWCDRIGTRRKTVSVAWIAPRRRGPRGSPLPCTRRLPAAHAPPRAWQAAASPSAGGAVHPRAVLPAAVLLVRPAVDAPVDAAGMESVYPARRARNVDYLRRVVRFSSSVRIPCSAVAPSGLEGVDLRRSGRWRALPGVCDIVGGRPRDGIDMATCGAGARTIRRGAVVGLSGS